MVYKYPPSIYPLKKNTLHPSIRSKKHTKLILLTKIPPRLTAELVGLSFNDVAIFNWATWHYWPRIKYGSYFYPFTWSDPIYLTRLIIFFLFLFFFFPLFFLITQHTHSHPLPSHKEFLAFLCWNKSFFVFENMALAFTSSAIHGSLSSSSSSYEHPKGNPLLFLPFIDSIFILECDNFKLFSTLVSIFLCACISYM